MSLPQAMYPVQFSVDYPDRPLNRVTTALRIFAVIPIMIVLQTVSAPRLLQRVAGAMPPMAPTCDTS